jgi:hypothetical protein
MRARSLVRVQPWLSSDDELLIHVVYQISRRFFEERRVDEREG